MPHEERRSRQGGGDISGDSLDRVHRVYLRWFGKHYDVGALDCVLATAAAERLGGDPPWLLVVGGSGAAKTETVMPLTEVGAVAVSTINGEAALLSGTSAKDRTKGATGGLLRGIGSSGILVIKDVTSILSMNRDTRALVLAALREIYDGHWSRNVGTDGGKTLTWKGRIVLIGAVTTAWDSAHQVIATMGDRFVLVRLNYSIDHRQNAGRQAMLNVDSEITMRHELREAVKAVLQAVDPDAEIMLSEAEVDALLGLADLVTRARTAVERDFKGNPLFAHALEMPTRFAKQLVQIVRGGIALGMRRTAALAVAVRCAGDSVPPLRLAVLGDVAAHPGSSTTAVCKRQQLPRSTVDKILQELHLLSLLTVEDESWGSGVRWVYSLAKTVNPDSLRALTRHRGSPEMSPPLEDEEIPAVVELLRTVLGAADHREEGQPS